MGWEGEKGNFLPSPCRYVGVSDEQHHMQSSLYRSVLLHNEAGEGGATGSIQADGDYAKANSGNR